MPIEQKLMLTDDILQDLTQENVVFQKEYTRQVYDAKSIITNGSPLKDSSVTYLKNELPRSRAAGYLKGRSTTYNPINSTVLALVRFDRVSYTLFLDLVLLRILISLLHFHAPLL